MGWTRTIAIASTLLAIAGTGCAQETVELGGTCTVGQAPVSGAVVTLFERDHTGNTFRALQTAEADGDGRFGFRPVRAFGSQELASRFYVLVAKADGHGAAFATLRSTKARWSAISLALTPAAPCSGKILGPDFKPVRDATVTVLFVNPPTGVARKALHGEFWGTGKDDLHAGLTTTTDAQGAFALAALPRGAEITLMVSHPKFARKRVKLKPPATLDAVVMDSGATIAGRVIDAAGQPVAGVPVQAQAVRGMGWAETRTDAQGRYRLESLPSAAYNVWAVKPGLTVKALDRFEVRGGKTRQAPDLQLIEGGFIEGRVVDAQTGAGVKPGRHGDIGLYGPARPKSGAAIQSAPIRPDGTFRIRAAPGKNYVYLRAGAGHSAVKPSHQWVEVQAGQTVRVEFGVRSR